jgi:adenylate cyclase
MKADKTELDQYVEKTWHDMLTYGITDEERRLRKFFSMFHAPSKCKTCYVPFDHFVSPLMSMFFHKERSSYNPNFCNVCEDFARKHQGGAEIELSMLFADIRGSTTIAENMSNAEFKNLIDRFYQVTTDIFIKTDAMIDKLVGDEVTAFYVPGMAGPDYTSKAVSAAQEILNHTGHRDPQGPWAPIGIGIHTGVAVVGAVGTSNGVVDVTALGDAVNVAARLASMAKAGEILLSDETVRAAKVDASSMEKRTLNLKGKSDSFDVNVIRVTP